MNSESFVSGFLNQDSFVLVNESVIRALDGDCTTSILLARLISLHRYYADREQLIDGYFFQTVKNIQDKLGINDYHQRKSFAKLEELGLLSTKVIGSPPIRYFKLDFDKIQKIVLKETQIYQKPSKKVDKSQFYTNINSNISWFRIDDVRGNIPRQTAELMFALSTSLGHRFAGWNPENYGILSRYYEKVYLKAKRPFDYRRLTDFLCSNEPATVKSFIKFDQVQPEDGNAPQSVEEFLKEQK